MSMLNMIYHQLAFTKFDRPSFTHFIVLLYHFLCISGLLLLLLSAVVRADSR